MWLCWITNGLGAYGVEGLFLLIMKGCTLKPVGVDWCLLIASSFCFSRFLLVLKASEKWSDHLALEGPGELVGSGVGNPDLAF